VLRTMLPVKFDRMCVSLSTLWSLCHVIMAALWKSGYYIFVLYVGSANMSVKLEVCFPQFEIKLCCLHYFCLPLWWFRWSRWCVCSTFQTCIL